MRNISVPTSSTVNPTIFAFSQTPLSAHAHEASSKRISSWSVPIHTEAQKLTAAKASCSLPVDEDVASTDAGTASMTSTEKLRHAADLLGISVQDLSRALAAQTLSINTGHSSDHVETDGGHFNHAQALILETPNEDAMHAPEQSCDGTGDSLVSWLQTYANGPSHQDIFHLDTWLGTDRYDPSLFLPELDTAVSCSTEHVDAFQLAGDGAQQYPPQESHDLLQSSAPANSTEDDKAGATAGTIPHDHEIPQDSTLRPPSLSGTSTGRISKQDGKGVQATNAGGLMLPQLSRTTASLSRTMTPGSSTASSHTLSSGSTPTSTRQRDEAGRRFRYLAEHGPCSNVWIPPRTVRHAEHEGRHPLTTSQGPRQPHGM